MASCVHVLAIWDDALDWYPPVYLEREYPEIPEHLSANDYTEEELVAALGDLRTVLERCEDDFEELANSFTLWKALLPSLSTPISRLETCVDGWCNSSYRITYATAEPDVAEAEITQLLRRLAVGVRQLVSTMSHGV